MSSRNSIIKKTKEYTRQINFDQMDYEDYEIALFINNTFAGKFNINNDSLIFKYLLYS